MHRNVEHVEDVVYAPRSEHEAWVDGTPHNAPEGVPCPLVKPVKEVIVAILDHMRRRSVVKPGQGKVGCSAGFLLVLFHMCSFLSQFL